MYFTGGGGLGIPVNVTSSIRVAQNFISFGPQLQLLNRFHDNWTSVASCLSPILLPQEQWKLDQTRWGTMGGSCTCLESQESLPVLEKGQVSHLTWKLEAEWGERDTPWGQGLLVIILPCPSHKRRVLELPNIRMIGACKMETVLLNFVVAMIKLQRKWV